jgi:hypothetical protein
MTSSAYVNPVLALDASDADATGAYACTRSLEENARFARGEWETMRQSLNRPGAFR